MKDKYLISYKKKRILSGVRERHSVKCVQFNWNKNQLFKLTTLMESFIKFKLNNALKTIRIVTLAQTVPLFDRFGILLIKSF